MNLELPFMTEADATLLDERLAAIDHELDDLFLEEIDRVLQQLIDERGDGAAAVA